MPEERPKFTVEGRVALRMTHATQNLEHAIEHLNRVLRISDQTVADRHRRGLEATEAERRITLALEEMGVIREALKDIRSGHLPAGLSQYIREPPPPRAVIERLFYYATYTGAA